MTVPDPLPAAPDWEAFYRDYRKPGYVPGFELIGKLGGGMFGLVFRARKQSIGKDYAIKFLKVEDPQVARAVLAELDQVQYFAQIDHPNLVSIEDRGEVDGIPYLVMAFAGTETLRDKVRGDGQPPAPAEREDLLRWFLQACRGAAALHDRALVHFDIKPANVFLKGSVARLGDYGLSKLVTESRGSLSTGRGTPYYMAPELLQRRGDHRSDIYSLGVLLYELLCGQVPFRGDSEWEVLKKHELEPPALPAHLLAAERAVLQRCLQKDPAARFQSVHDLIVALGGPVGVAAAAVAEGASAMPLPPLSSHGAMPPCLPPHAPPPVASATAPPPPAVGSAVPAQRVPLPGPFPPPLPRHARRRGRWGWLVVAGVLLAMCGGYGGIKVTRSTGQSPISYSLQPPAAPAMPSMPDLELHVPDRSRSVQVLGAVDARLQRLLVSLQSSVQTAERTQRRTTLRELDRGLRTQPDVEQARAQLEVLAVQESLSPTVAKRLERQARAAVLAAVDQLQRLDFKTELDCHRGAQLLQLLGSLTAIDGLSAEAPDQAPSKRITARFSAAADAWRRLAEQFAGCDADFEGLLRATGKLGR